MIAKCRRNLLKADLGIGDQRNGIMLGAIIRLNIQRQNLAVGVLEQRPGTGGEILETRTDAHHQVGIFRNNVRAFAAGDTNGAEVQAMIPGKR